MWKQKIDKIFVMVPFLLIWFLLPSKVVSLPHSPNHIVSSQGALNVHQWQALVRDALQYLQKHQKQQRQETVEPKPKIRFIVEPTYNYGGNGMMKLRNIRSGFGDMAKLFQLHEENFSKSRPRFGKRAEVTQENFLPSSYGYEDEYEDRAAGDIKDSIPGDELPMAERSKWGKGYKVPEEYLQSTL